MLKIDPKTKKKYPELRVGYFTVKNLQNKEFDEVLEKIKRETEQFVKDNFSNLEENMIIKKYDSFYKNYGKTYPVRFQVKSILDGKEIPSRSCILEAMFMAELKHLILTAGHDLDKIQGELTTNVVKGEEKYTNISTKVLTLKEDDIFTSDEKGIISSVLFGPDERTKITNETKNYLFFSYSLGEISYKKMKDHFNDLIKNIKTFANKEIIISEFTVV